jgi:hypothetical protein
MSPKFFGTKPNRELRSLQKTGARELSGTENLLPFPRPFLAAGHPY